VEAEAGTTFPMLFILMMKVKEATTTIPLNIVIERQKQGLPSCPELNDTRGTSLTSQPIHQMIWFMYPTEMNKNNPFL